MPALPWKSSVQPDPEQQVLVMATRLPLLRHRHTPRFMLRTSAVRRQLKTTDGLIGYALNAKPISNIYMTVSAWVDNEHLMRFVVAEPHRTIMRSVRPLMGAPTFVTWTAGAAELPPSWTEVQRRLANRPAVDSDSASS